MKWSQIKKGISLTLCVLMVLTLLPISTLAEDAAPTDTGTPTEASQPVSEEAPAGSEEAPTAAQDAAEATPTPTPMPTPTPELALVDPTASETPTEDIIPEGPKTYVINFVIDNQTIWGMQQTVAEGDFVASPGIPAVPDGADYVGQVFLYWYKEKGSA